MLGVVLFAPTEEAPPTRARGVIGLSGTLPSLREFLERRAAARQTDAPATGPP